MDASTPRRFDWATHVKTKWYTINDFLYDAYDHDKDLRSPQAVLVGIDKAQTQADVNAMYTLCARASYLPRADFTIYNATYHTSADHDTCDECYGAGGTVSGEMQGDGYMTAYVEFFEPCDNCLGAGLCPGCMQPLALSYDRSAMPVLMLPGIPDFDTGAPTEYEYDTYAYDIDSGAALESFVCLVCDWRYDADRHYDRNPDYYDLMSDPEARGDYYDPYMGDDRDSLI